MNKSQRCVNKQNHPKSSKLTISIMQYENINYAKGIKENNIDIMIIQIN